MRNSNVHVRAARALAGALLVAGALVGPAPSGRARADDDKLEVVCTLPHLAAIAGEVGGDRVAATALASGLVDPHFVIATPGLMATASSAELYVEVGMQLELWSERVIDGARNPRIRVGQDGHVYTFLGVDTLQAPTTLSRVQGDVHPLGNPHIWLDPLNAKIQARNVALALARVDPAGRETYERNLAAFVEKLDRAYYGEELVTLLGADLLDRLARSGKLFDFLAERSFKGARLDQKLGASWLGRMWSHRRTAFVGYHQTWIYFARAFDLGELGQLEPKPGIPPTPGHLAQLAEQCEAAGARVVLCEPYFPIVNAESFAERVGGVAVRMPTEPGVDGIEGYVGLIDELVRRFVEAAEKTRR
jgi:zinc/manganese transport system substrate-binding protein